MSALRFSGYIAALGLGLVSMATQADDGNIDTRWYVAPFGTYMHSGGDRQASDGWGGGLGLGKMLDRHFNIEMKGFYLDFAGQSGPWSMAGGSVEAQHYMNRDRFSPYTVISIGGVNTCLGSQCAAGFIGEAGLGFSYRLCDQLLFRSDVRYRYNNNFDADLQPGTNEYNDMVVNAGFVVPLGDKPEPVVAKTQSPQPLPQPQPADCAAQDADGDGVNNCQDKCPDTPKDSKANRAGCPLQLVLKNEHFLLDSARLTPAAMAILDEVAASLLAYPDKNPIEVRGHTSSEGEAGYNLLLSKRRAQSVVDYLESKGVDNPLLAKGFGKANPIADNRTLAGRRTNRRVELIWLQH